MIELERAVQIVKGVAPSGDRETVPLVHARGRALAEEVRSLVDSPPFDKSAMDGFAIGKKDASGRYRILETVAAGKVPVREVRTGECSRIMTGAMLPAGTDRVYRKELVEEKDAFIRPVKPETSDNVIRRGENLRAGDVVLRPKVLLPQDIGILAAAGIAKVAVAALPRVGVLSTGPEIREPGSRLEPGEIHDSNGPQLIAQLSALGVPSRHFGIVPDDPGALKAAMASALRDCDTLLLTGGVSEGDFDYVPRALVELGGDLGAEILFHGVAVKPGKPTLFARVGGRFAFGLPGNPVSTFVIFELLVKPFLFARMGVDWTPALYRGTLESDISRKSTDRDEIIPVRVRDGKVSPVRYHGSAHLNALGEADGLVRVPRGVSLIRKGEDVDVRPV